MICFCASTKEPPPSGTKYYCPRPLGGARETISVQGTRGFSAELFHIISLNEHRKTKVKINGGVLGTGLLQSPGEDCINILSTLNSFY